jgi:hypothetical protein
MKAREKLLLWLLGAALFVASRTQKIDTVDLTSGTLRTQVVLA